jgi:hypothetical protein
VINWDLIKNPFNWFIVVLMLLIACFAFHLLIKLFSGSQSGDASAIPDTFNNTDGS